MHAIKINVKWCFGLLILFFCSCTPLISTFDQIAYQQATSLKVDALNLMDKSVEDYLAHDNEVKVVQLNIAKAIEYDRHRLHNEITTKMWLLLNDPDGHLFGGFLVKWKSEGKCGNTYVMAKKKQIADAFDQIAELESGKIKPNQVKNQ